MARDSSAVIVLGGLAAGLFLLSKKNEGQAEGGSSPSAPSTPYTPPSIVVNVPEQPASVVNIPAYPQPPAQVLPTVLPEPSPLPKTTPLPIPKKEDVVNLIPPAPKIEPDVFPFTLGAGKETLVNVLTLGAKSGAEKFTLEQAKTGNVAAALIGTGAVQAGGNFLQKLGMTALKEAARLPDTTIKVLGRKEALTGLGAVALPIGIGIQGGVALGAASALKKRGDVTTALTFGQSAGALASAAVAVPQVGAAVGLPAVGGVAGLLGIPAAFAAAGATGALIGLEIDKQLDARLSPTARRAVSFAGIKDILVGGPVRDALAKKLTVPSITSSIAKSTVKSIVPVSKVKTSPAVSTSPKFFTPAKTSSKPAPVSQLPKKTSPPPKVTLSVAKKSTVKKKK